MRSKSIPTQARGAVDMALAKDAQLAGVMGTG